MLSLLRPLTTAVTRTPPAAHSFIAFYSTVSGLARRNWGTAGPAPQSLVQLEPENENGRHEGARSGGGTKQRSKLPFSRKVHKDPTPPAIVAHRRAMKREFPEGWSPPRKLSREAIDGLRSLNAHDPETFTTPMLASRFRISPEAVRRILKSKWEPSKEQREKLLERERRSREAWIEQRRKEEQEAQAELARFSPSIGMGRNRKDKLSLT